MCEPGHCGMCHPRGVACFAQDIHPFALCNDLSDLSEFLSIWHKKLCGGILVQGTNARHDRRC